MAEKPEKRFRVWQAPLSGEHFAGWAVREEGNRWRMAGKRYDVTADIERIIAEAAHQGGPR